MECQGRPLRVAVVDDDAAVRTSLRRLLNACGHEVRLFASVEEVLHQEREIEVDCFLVDLYMPMLSGLGLAERLRSRGSRVPIVLMTGHDDEQTRTAVAQSGLPMLLKPFDEGEFLAAVGLAPAEGTT
jgi:two-component system response regulator FixJ